MLNAFKTLEDDSNQIVAYPPNTTEWNNSRLGDFWTGRDQYLWISFNITIPSSWINKKVIFHIDINKTGGNNGFEALAFINNVPSQGLDSNHKEIVIHQELLSQKQINITLRLWSGIEPGGPKKEMMHQFTNCFMSQIDELVDDLYYTSRAIVETIEQIPSTDVNVSKLSSLLNQSFHLIDYTLMNDKEAFYNNLHIAQSTLRSGVEELSKHSDITIHCIGHTHIDVAYLWRLKHTRQKSIRSFLTVLRLMEQYQDYHFLQSQPKLYEFIKEDYPEVYQDIKQRIVEKRWEASGAMWVEADCNLISGESLVRQILIGKKFFKEEFNIDSDFLWLPDVFGYSWALPQILVKSGIRTFLTSKISWNQYNKIPHDTFKWRGIDGTEILTHMITTPNVNQSKDSWYYTYNGMIHANTIDETWNRYVDKELNQELLLPFGYGDGGGGVTSDMLEMINHLAELPGLPNIKITRSSDFFNQLHETIKSTDQYVHTWDGELYLEYHRGTYTSQAKIKQWNRQLEFLFREMEILDRLLYTCEPNYSFNHQSNFEKGWKIILTNQFHDIIPGSSINEVYLDAYEDYKLALDYINQIKINLHTLLQPQKSSHSIFNASNWVRNDLITINTNQELQFYDSQGKLLLSQHITDGYLVKLDQLAPLSFTTLYSKEEPNKQLNEAFTFHQNQIETPFYNISLDDCGHITKLYDKEEDREVLKGHQKGNVIQTFEDRPMKYDAWDIDLYYQEKMYEVNQLIEMTLIENGPLRMVIRFVWKHHNSTIKQDMCLYTHTKRIDFKTDVNWLERRHLMKVAFPVDIRSTKATYDIQFGNVERPTHWNTSWDYARFEVLGHKWADLSDGGYGVSLLNDCKYGYDIKDHVMRLTLLKSAIYPDPTADLGDHKFTYALLPHNGTWRDAETEIEAFFLNNPLTVYYGQSSVSQSFFQIDKSNIEIDAIKKCEYDLDLILRFHEYKGMKTTIVITSDFQMISYVECDLMENEISDRFENDHIKLTINPYEIKTYKVKIK